MFEAENIRDWRGHDVVDTDGHKIGALEAIYVDTGTDLPSFATVTVGMMGRHRLVFVPLDRATVGVKDTLALPREVIDDWFGLTGRPWVRGTSRSCTARSK